MNSSSVVSLSVKGRCGDEFCNLLKTSWARLADFDDQAQAVVSKMVYLVDIGFREESIHDPIPHRTRTSGRCYW